MKSYLAKASETNRKWILIDAADQPLGRLAANVAMILMGKNKVTYTPHCDVGDFVIVINVEKVKLTGSKWTQKTHDYYTYYPGGHKYVRYDVLREKHPGQIIELAVRGMLPKSRLGRDMLRKLRCYKGPVHPHTAQQPSPFTPNC